ncbi:MAG: hypothetical protein ABR903_05465 [Thermodesulfovibrionales bacterium]
MRASGLPLGITMWCPVCQMPDTIGPAAFSMAISAGGALKSCKITPLLTAEKTIDAMKKAPKSGHKPPAK